LSAVIDDGREAARSLRRYVGRASPPSTAARGIESTWSEGVVDGFEPADLVVEVAEIIVHEGDEPNFLAHLFDADAFASEDDAKIGLLPIEADATACRHGDGPVVEGRKG
jgi:hypothetical protein